MGLLGVYQLSWQYSYPKIKPRHKGDQMIFSSNNESGIITSGEVFFYKNRASFAGIMQIQNG